MRLHFIMINNNIKENYFAEYKKINNKIVFSDSKNVIEIINEDGTITITKKGEANMVQSFKLNTYIKGKYEVMGIDINIASYTKKLEINEKGMFIEYDQYLDDELSSEIKIYIKYTS